MASFTLSLLIFLSVIAESLCWRCAYYRNLFDQQPEYLECLVGCCGDSWNRHCCSEAGLIIGCCLAAVFIVIVSIIIACCVMKKRKRREEAYMRARYPAAGMNIREPGYLPPGRDRKY
ncbi:uncharacterized protein [Haliotis asinina]|uniref:uncharacterized protein n=1 Tax=Haliotis asinina TaxID=109174 RepID=UPI003531D2CD